VAFNGIRKGKWIIRSFMRGLRRGLVSSRLG
jgi:hypothetical protein